MGSDGVLARVTYLPGVTPPVAASEPNVSSSSPMTPMTPMTPAAPDLEHEERRAENVSMHALTRRGQSRWELRQILLARELEPSIVEAELYRLERVGLIDDGALAETIVRTQHERKGLGRTALVAELRRRRIDQDAIDRALEQVGADDEVLRAGQLAERRAAQLRGLDHDTAVRRLSGYLQRKGYSSDTVRSAVLAALPLNSSGVRFR
ncbi:MAG: regulatory protein RecX [Terrimesophilobacter sp.]